MSLPKIGQRLVIVLLLLAFFFVSSPLAYAAPQSGQIITPQKGTDGQSYLIIPVSGLTQNQAAGSTATVGASLEGGQVLGFDILGMFDAIWDALKAVGQGFEQIGKCLINPAGCALKGMKALFDFGTMAFEKFILNQVGGEATDCFMVAQNDPDRPAKCSELDSALKDFQQGRPVSLDPTYFGLLGISAQATTTALAIPLPFDSTTYLASLNPFAKARATTGTDELEKSGIVLDIWKKVRDGSYILLVVAVVIIGFMIMFRVPIGPRAIVTAQSSLPRIAIAMLLITFSFLLAGLMLDATRLVGNLLQSFLPSISVTGAAAGAAAILLSLVLIFLIALFVAVAIFNVAAPLVLILFLLLIVLVLFAMFVIITYKLVTRLVIFLLMVMFAPLFFLAGALPRGEAAIFFWFKRTAAALLAIPATGFVVSLALVIGSSGVKNLDLSFAVTGLPAEAAAGKLVDVFSWAFAAPIIGLVLLSFAIKTPDIIDELFGVKGFGTRAAGLGAIIGAPGKAFTTAGSVGRSVGGVRELKEISGRALTARGYGLRPAGETAGGVETVPPATTKSGFWPAAARLTRRVTGPLTAPREEEERPWRPITRQVAQQQKAAEKSGEQAPSGQAGGAILPDKSDEILKEFDPNPK